MTGLCPAMGALAGVIEAETTALAAGDYQAAARLAPEKIRAADRFLAARAQHTARGASPAEPDLPGTLNRLRRAMAANRTALERALVVQGRVIEAVARAARPPEAGAGGYARRPSGSIPPVTLSVRS